MPESTNENGDLLPALAAETAMRIHETRLTALMRICDRLTTAELRVLVEAAREMRDEDSK